MKNFKIGKRILAGVFAVAMSGLVPLSIVSAEDKSSEITYEKRTKYEINIPASISVEDTKPTDNQQITISTPNISGEKELNVTVLSEFKYEIYCLREQKVPEEENQLRQLLRFQDRVYPKM